MSRTSLPPVPPFSRHAAAGICCAAGIYGVGCLKCTGCAAGTVGCAVGSAACYECIQKQKQKQRDSNPNYDPPGSSQIIDRSTGENNGRINNKDVIDYIRKELKYPINNDDDIIEEFKNVVNLRYEYSEPSHIFKEDQQRINNKIKKLNADHHNKKIVGGKKTKKGSKQKTTRKRRNPFLKNKKKRKTNKHSHK